MYYIFILVHLSGVKYHEVIKSMEDYGIFGYISTLNISNNDINDNDFCLITDSLKRIPGAHPYFLDFSCN